MGKINRVIMVVLDSAGAGFLPDAKEYGDLGANTLGHIGEAVGLDVPNMENLGLGNIIDIRGVKKIEKSAGLYGKAAEKSKGKDTTIGHWEIAGIITSEPLPTYPEGFPEEIIEAFENAIGRKSIGNRVASGTEIIDSLGDEHVRTGFPIVYTSADSVFQIAAHEGIIPLETLYDYCHKAREMLRVGRVIARPFTGKSGAYQRTPNRHDYSLEPPETTILDKLKDAGQDVIGVGKIYDIFAGKGLTGHVRTTSNMDGVDRTIEFMKLENKGLIFTNLVDFDMKYGHRRDVEGYKDSLEEFDARMPEIYEAMNENDLLIITADHGCDPIFKGTDHTREYIPILAYAKGLEGQDLGIRASFADIAATIEELLLGTKKKGSFAERIN